MQTEFVIGYFESLEQRSNPVRPPRTEMDSKVEQNDNVSRDELIMQQQREIEKEVSFPGVLVAILCLQGTCAHGLWQISDTIPLVSEKVAVSCLTEEYLGDVVFIEKIQDLAGKYSHMRRTRPDGNCFFRAFAYAYMETLISNKDDYEQFRQLAEKSKDKLISLGFPKFTLEDFHETVNQSTFNQFTHK